MTHKLTAFGDQLALVLDPALLERLRIGPDTPLEVETDGETLTVRPVREASRKARIREATGKMMDAHDETLRELAK